MGTLSGIEVDMLKKILGDVKSKGFIVDQIVIDHDTSTNVTGPAKSTMSVQKIADF